ncbi:hypothetical protein [Streptomyces sp. WAC05374]|nr:hypothetical protein [Streptomyces sp. WAC05374]
MVNRSHGGALVGGGDVQVREPRCAAVLMVNVHVLIDGQRSRRGTKV